MLNAKLGRRAAGVNALRNHSVIRGSWVAGSVTDVPPGAIRYKSVCDPGPLGGQLGNETHPKTMPS